AADNETRILERIQHEYQKRKLEKVTKLNKIGSIGCARVIPKMKDLTRMRPLVSYTQFISRNASKLASRCLTVIEKDLNKKWNSINLTKTDNLAKVIKAINQTHEIRKVEKWTFLELDIKDQFTCLDKSDVMESLKRAIQTVGHGKTKSFAIMRRKTEKKRDCV